MLRLVVATGVLAFSSSPHVSSFGNAFFATSNHYNDASMKRKTSMCPQLNAQEPSTSQPAQPTSESAPNARTRTKKKNKYAHLSKADNLSMDPLDAMIFESRTKLRDMYREDSKSLKRRRKLSSSEILSLEAVDRLLSDYKDMGVNQGAAEVEETRERNKRIFPDTTTIDPYDPTTYGYIELGTIVGAHGVHGLMKLTSITDFSQHRLCEPGTRHIKPPNRRSPREIRLVEGRPFRSNATNVGTDSNPTYLIRLENVDDRDEALKMRGFVMYALEDEKVNDLLEKDEYIVSDLIGLNVFLDENTEEHSGRGFEDLFVGNICGVVLGSEMCAIPGLGQDLLEVALPSSRGGKGKDLVLIPFVPEIVTRVNLEGRLVSIVPPRGLLDLSYRREEKVRIKGLLPPARDS